MRRRASTGSALVTVYALVMGLLYTQRQGTTRKHEMRDDKVGARDIGMVSWQVAESRALDVW